jgi:hypothetical protein
VSDTLSQEELERRKPLWLALSEMFLDTKLDDFNHTQIARVMKNSRYGLSEIERILNDEVYPACLCNLEDPVGVWDYFDEDAV